MDHLAEAERLFLEAVTLQERGELDQAERLYKNALALAPGRPSVMNNLATVLLGTNKHAEARVLCERLLEINPEDETALLNMGNCQLRLNLPAEALSLYERALGIKPDYPDALSNRGNALLELKRPEEALASYDRALAIKPDHADALYNRGNALQQLKRPDQALASYDRALAIRPGHADALYNRGNALLGLRNLEEAVASYDRALEVRPDDADALNNRALALLALNRREEVAGTYERLIKVAPDHPYIRGHLLHAKLHCCDWPEYDRSVAQVVEGVRAGRRADAPFNFLAISESAEDQLRCSRIFAADECPAFSPPLWSGERYRHNRIRVAYVSADLHDHAVPFLIAGLFEAHDRTRFDITAVSLGPDRIDGMRNRLRATCNRFVDVRTKSDREVALILRDMEIDIVVDLQGYTDGCRPGIFSHRPAPVHVNYLGYPGTMGTDCIDYIVGDRHVIPHGHHSCFAEKVVYLPDCYQVNDSKRRIAERTPTRAELGLPVSGFVFCCFNNNYKIAPRVFDLWMRLLRKVEGSVLWLLEDNKTVVRNFRLEAESRGVAHRRLVFAPRVKMEEHLARQRRADLFLDTLPYNAHVTASDALWVGLPLLTRTGSTFAGRVATSLLNAIGLQELVTATWEDYERLALELAADGKRLAGLKAKLAENRTTGPLFDTDRFRRHIEVAYTTMWERVQRGEPPASFAVPGEI